MHLAHVVFHRLDNAVNEGFFQLDVAQTGDNFFLVADDFLLDGRHAAVHTSAAVQFFVDLALFFVGLFDFVQQQDDP